jgi:predicted aspartyl protease
LPDTFPLIRYGQLLLGQAEIGGPQGTRRLWLLLDTGSNYTVVAVEALEAIGCSPATSKDHIRVTTADGVLIAPRIRTEALTVFERRLPGALIIAHDLPFTGPIDGLLGMDVLVALQARIDVAGARIDLA